MSSIPFVACRKQEPFAVLAPWVFVSRINDHQRRPPSFFSLELWLPARSVKLVKHAREPASIVCASRTVEAKASKKILPVGIHSELAEDAICNSTTPIARRAAFGQAQARFKHVPSTKAKAMLVHVRYSPTLSLPSHPSLSLQRCQMDSYRGWYGRGQV